MLQPHPSPMKKYILIALLAVINVWSISCVKESVEAPIVPSSGDSLATFFLSNIDSCHSQISSSGQVLVGKSLTSSEALALQVRVETAGKFEFSTDTLNGYYFNGSGRFTDTGLAQIVLTGHGNPLLPGTSFFSLKAGDTIIRHPIAAIDTSLVLEDVPEKLYFKADIGGEFYDMTITSPNSNGLGLTWLVAEPTILSLTVFVPADSGSYSGGQLTLNKGYFHGFESATMDQLKKFFAPGAYPYATLTCGKFGGGVTDGISIYWSDSDHEFGNDWLSFAPFLDQTGSSFKIVGLEDWHDDLGNTYAKALIRFNCKLYSYKTGKIVELKNGEMSTGWGITE